MEYECMCVCVCSLTWKMLEDVIKIVWNETEDMKVVAQLMIIIIRTSMFFLIFSFESERYMDAAFTIQRNTPKNERKNPTPVNYTGLNGIAVRLIECISNSLQTQTGTNNLMLVEDSSTEFHKITNEQNTKKIEHWWEEIAAFEKKRQVQLKNENIDSIKYQLNSW